MYRLFSIFFGCFFLIVSCQKVIDVEVDEADENIIIDASYNANDEVVKVKVTRSVALFSGQDTEGVNGASIEIVSPDGEVYVLNELGDGEYEYTDLIPLYNESYVMKASIEGLDYEATAFLPSVIPLSFLSREFVEESLFGEEGYVVFMNIPDPGGDNFYRATRVVNGEKLTDLSDQFLFDNSFSQGNFQIVPFFGSRYEIGDTISVRLKSYSEEAFTYFDDLFALSSDNGQSAAPANPRTNWNNGALGVFNAFGYDEKTIIIEE